ncbi:hypothetical protein ABZU32_40495 [Sphaerisporangium sp. NPDC005288]|uniref:hypothetical protein n=1 Tax=Sphaerisporangium sp. NPDC005288 TaxID=3155114 RepID=UPI0033A427B4
MIGVLWGARGANRASIVLGHDGRWPAFAHASYTNGQHRSQAMIEAGVRRTITLDWTSR